MIDAGYCPSTQERVLSAIAHISVVLGFMSVLVSAGIWLLKKDESRLIRFHALQALAFQITFVLAASLGFVAYALALVFSGFIMMISAAFNLMPLGIFVMWLPMIFFAMIMLAYVIAVIMALFAAYKAYCGSFWNYPAIGGRVLCSLGADYG